MARVWSLRYVLVTYMTFVSQVHLLAPPGKPQITGFPSGAVLAGTQLNLKCVASPPGDTYDWYKDNTKLTTSSSYDFLVKKESAGVYKCVGRRGGLSATSSDKTLTVYYKPDSLIVLSGETSSHAGERDKFTCAAIGGKPTPTLKIYFKRSGGTPVEVTQGQERVMAKEDNQAEYYCEATVPGYPALTMRSSSKTYSVKFPNTKVFFTNNPTAAGQAGRVKRFQCETDESNPISSMWWFMNNGSSWPRITTGVSSSERNGAYGGKIRISDVSILATKTMNGATVRCASNYANNLFISHADTTMNVKYKPDSVVVSSGKTSSHVGEKDEFTCAATGGNPSPTLKIYFKRSGGTPVEVTQGQERVIAKEDNQAEYYCEATVPGYPALTMRSSSKTYSITFTPNTTLTYVKRHGTTITARWVPLHHPNWTLRIKYCRIDNLGTCGDHLVTNRTAGETSFVIEGSAMVKSVLILYLQVFDGPELLFRSKPVTESREGLGTYMCNWVKDGVGGTNVDMIVGITVMLVIVGVFVTIYILRRRNMACFSGKDKRNEYFDNGHLLNSNITVKEM